MKAAWMLLVSVGFACAGAHAQTHPDLIIGDIPGSANYVVGGSPKAYSLSVAICNQGPVYGNFNPSTNAHPVVTQNMYRLQNGRFEQIGQSWALHMLTGVVEQNLCSTCAPTGDFTRLGAGCSTVSSASTMGIQSNFGPRSEVNAATGVETYPIQNTGTGTGSALKRLQVDAADLVPGPLYFVSAMCTAADDAAGGSNTNNESYRRVTVSFVTSSDPLSMQDTTQSGMPAIQAWRDHGLGANVPDPGVVLSSIDVAGDGRFWIASKATDLGGSQWHYEYAVQNLTSDRSGGGFSVPLPAGAVATNIGFHGVAYHSGEVYSNAAWVFDAAAGSVFWATPFTYAQDPNTSALRFDTLYNFWFDCNVAPYGGIALIGLFKPGTPVSVTGVAMVPRPPLCGSADFNCDGDTGTDADIESFFACIAGNCPSLPCSSSADFNGDGDVGTDADIEAFFRVLAGGGC